jgi:hypothetical protein
MENTDTEVAADNALLQGGGKRATDQKPAAAGGGAAPKAKKKSHKKKAAGSSSGGKKPVHTGPFPAEVAGLIALKQKKLAEVAALDKAIGVAAAAVRAARGEAKK